jgi:hypothetical protein
LGSIHPFTFWSISSMRKLIIIVDALSYKKVAEGEGK